MIVIKTFFISDLHLGHENCIRFDSRPWKSADEMDKEIIRRWNQKVRKEDRVFVLGDFAFRNQTLVAEYVRHLNGQIHLIRGNHDKRSEEYESPFYEVADYKEMSVNAYGVACRLVLSHYFIPFYVSARRNGFMLHGHSHMSEESVFEEIIKEQIREKGLRCEAYNVVVMWQNYEPQTLEEIIARQGRDIQIQ